MSRVLRLSWLEDPKPAQIEMSNKQMQVDESQNQPEGVPQKHKEQEIDEEQAMRTLVRMEMSKIQVWQTQLQIEKGILNKLSHLEMRAMFQVLRGHELLRLVEQAFTYYEKERGEHSL